MDSTAQFVAENWIQKKVSTTYATQVLRKTQAELQKESKSLNQQSQNFGQLAQQVGQVQPTSAQLSSAIEHDPRAAVGRSLQQLTQQKQAFRAVSEAGSQ